MTAFVPLDITATWAHVNEDLVELVDLVPEDKLNWSPRPELWNVRGILIHVCYGRHGMMSGVIQDGDTVPDVLGDGQTTPGLKNQLRTSWRRMEPFLADPERLGHVYDATILGQAGKLSGHDLAFGQLEHDIHHRADILHYLRELGIAHAEPDSLLRKLQRAAG